MHSLNLSAAMFAVLVVVSGAHAQTSGKPDLERRVDTLENKLDRVLDLLEKRSTAPGSNASRESLGGAVASTAASGFVPGMYLDLFASGIGLKLKASYNAIPEPVQLPRSRPTASIAITPRDTFDYGGFLDRPELTALARTGGSLVGVGYGSALQVRRNGPHEFVVSIRARETRHPAAACSAALYLNKQKLASTEKSANIEYVSAS